MTTGSFGIFESGASSISTSADAKHGTWFVLPEAGEVTKISAETDPNNMQHMAGIYRYAPGSEFIAGTGSQAGNGIAWRDYNLTTPTALQAGSYVLCIFCDNVGTTNLSMRYMLSGATDTNRSDTEANAWPSWETSWTNGADAFTLDRFFCINATYNSLPGSFDITKDIPYKVASTHDLEASEHQYKRWVDYKNNDALAVYGQQFTIGTNTINEELLLREADWRIYRMGSPYDVICNLKNVDGDGAPSGAVLSTGSIDGNTLATSDTGNFTAFNMSEYAMQPSTSYAITLQPGSNDVDNGIIVSATLYDEYAGGKDWYSDDGGSTWTSGAEDYVFGLMGHPTSRLKSLNYDVYSVGSVPISTDYKVDAYIPLKKSTDYKVFSSSALKKDINYNVFENTTIEKAINYSAKLNNSNTKGTDYKVETKTSLKKALNYEVESSSSIKKDINYDIKANNVLGKDIDYSVFINNEVKKDINYEVFSAPILKKNINYSVSNYDEIKKGCNYDVFANGEIKKDTNYKVQSETEIKKSLNYAVKIKTEIKKDVNYDVFQNNEIKKDINYGVYINNTELKNINYSTSHLSKLTKGIDYSVATNELLKKDINYSTKLVSSTIKDLNYSVSIADVNTKNISYKIGDLISNEKTINYKIKDLISNEKTINYNIFVNEEIKKDINYKVNNLISNKKTINYDVNNVTTSELKKGISYFVTPSPRESFILTIDDNIILETDAERYEVVGPDNTIVLDVNTSIPLNIDTNTEFNVDDKRINLYGYKSSVLDIKSSTEFSIQDTRRVALTDAQTNKINIKDSIILK